MQYFILHLCGGLNYCFLNVLISVEYATYSFRAPSLGHRLQLAFAVCAAHKAARLSLSKSNDRESERDIICVFCLVFLFEFLTLNSMKNNPSHDKQERGEGDQSPDTCVHFHFFFFIVRI